MMQFSTHESVSLEKTINLAAKPVETELENIEKVYEIQRCAKWIQSNNYKKVCLQFPDYLLPDSSAVAQRLQTILSETVYILGDTAYGSCCIDYVAASHINADAIVHFGPTCFSKTSGNIPYLNIYEKKDIDLKQLEKCYCELLGNITEDIVVLLDTNYLHFSDEIKKEFSQYNNVRVRKIDEDALEINGCVILFIGDNDRKLININLAFNPKDLYYLETSTSVTKIVNFKQDSKILKRRYFLIEKIKDSKTIGIVIGTVAVKNYLKVIDRIKRLVELNGKKYYLISVGKPTVAKLANFGEIDIYVMITCAMNEIYESRDFYKPIVTPYDVEVALNINAKNLKFSYDYNTVLANCGDLDNLKITPVNQTDVSLLTGKIRSHQVEEPVDSSSENQIALKKPTTVAVNSNFGAGFLADRTWKGLEQSLGQSEVKLAEEGRTGIAQGYDNESLL